MKRKVAIAIFAFFSGCQQEDLSRPKALELIRARSFQEKLSFSGSVDSSSTKNRVNAIDKLVDAKIIRCEVDKEHPQQRNCNTPGGKVIRENLFEFEVGEWFPTEVSGITKPESTMSIADVVMVYHRNSKYVENLLWFRILNPEGALSKPSSEPTENDTKTVKATYRLYDDGWRLERIEE